MTFILVVANLFWQINDGIACPGIDDYNDHDTPEKEKKSIPIGDIVRQHGTGNAPDSPVVIALDFFGLKTTRYI